MPTYPLDIKVYSGVNNPLQQGYIVNPQANRPFFVPSGRIGKTIAGQPT